MAWIASRGQAEIRPAARNNGSPRGWAIRTRAWLFVAQNLLDAGVRYAGCGGDGAVAVAVGDGRADCGTPRLFGAGTGGGGPFDPRKTVAN